MTSTTLLRARDAEALADQEYEDQLKKLEDTCETFLSNDIAVATEARKLITLLKKCRQATQVRSAREMDER